MLAEIDISQLWNSNIEMFAVISGVICVALITFEHQNRKLAWWNWPIGAASSAAFVYVFWNYELYFNSALQVFYVLTAFYGGWAWLRGKQGKELSVTRLDMKWLPSLIALNIAAATALATSFDVLGVDSARPFWDALVVCLSLTAQALLTRKIYQNWFFWIAVDVIGIWLFASQGLVLTAVLYFVYGCICIRGLYEWHKAEVQECVSE